jgi:exodeoxyribonuclease VII large subunit
VDLQVRLLQQIRRMTGFFEQQLFLFKKRIGYPRRRLVDLTLRLDDYGVRLRLALRAVLDKKSGGLTRVKEKLLMVNPRDKILEGRNRLAIQKLKLRGLIEKKVEQREMGLRAQQKTLLALSPWGILDRGYALVRTLPELALVKKVEDARPGQEIRVSLSHGEMDCLVEETRKKEERPFVQGTV